MTDWLLVCWLVGDPCAWGGVTVAGDVVAGGRPLRLQNMGGGSCRDLDDVGALCAANALEDRGEIELQYVQTCDGAPMSFPARGYLTSPGEGVM